MSHVRGGALRVQTPEIMTKIFTRYSIYNVPQKQLCSNSISAINGYRIDIKYSLTGISFFAKCSKQRTS